MAVSLRANGGDADPLARFPLVLGLDTFGDRNA